MTTDAPSTAFLDDLRTAVDGALEELWLDQLADHPNLAHLVEAMRYSLLAPGKRIRPVLTLAAAEACGAVVPSEGALRAALAFELVHAYSLVHDDLPCMDDDDLRRGMPTSHRAYGEGTAVLVGDALQAEAFALVAEAPLPAEVAIEVVRTLARAAGWLGMVGGQQLDIAGEQDGGALDLPALRELHGRKTGALIAGAIEVGGIVARADGAVRARLWRFGSELGWLFQVVDDLLDEVGDESATGKAAGSDRRQAKTTAVSLLGVEGLRAHADEQLVRCLDLAGELPSGGGRLGRIAEFVRHRDR